jgi:hypothetical protein
MFISWLRENADMENLTEVTMCSYLLSVLKHLTFNSKIHKHTYFIERNEIKFSE